MANYYYADPDYERRQWWENYPSYHQRALLALMLSKISIKAEVSDQELNALLDVAIEKRMFVVKLLEKMGRILDDFGIDKEGLELPKSSDNWYQTYPKQEDNEIAERIHHAIRNKEDLTYDDLLELLDIMCHDVRLEGAIKNTYDRLREACLTGLEKSGTVHLVIPGHTPYWDITKMFRYVENE